MRKKTFVSEKKKLQSVKKKLFLRENSLIYKGDILKNHAVHLWNIIFTAF